MIYLGLYQVDPVQGCIRQNQYQVDPVTAVSDGASNDRTMAGSSNVNVMTAECVGIEWPTGVEHLCCLPGFASIVI